ncbi:MAG TPA: YceI family protein [Flavipsychrobacter sp.]
MYKKSFLPVLAGSMLFVACSDAPKADNAEVSDAQNVEQTSGVAYEANLSESKIEWVGTKPVGRHHGTFQLKDGELIVSGDELEGGSFVIDVASIKPDDQDEEGNAKLQGHLKSEDFFHVEKYPESKFEITSITEGVQNTEDLVMKDATHTITGNLTMKGITKSITFPAKVYKEGDKIMADANFNIDRTQWDIVYGNDQSLGDKFIRPEVNLQVHLVADRNL